MTPASRAAVILLAVGLVVAAWCASGLAGASVDPALLAEAAGVALLGPWLALLARRLGATEQVRRALLDRSEAVTINGIACRLLPGNGRRAMVAGVVRPVIFLDQGVLAVLDPAELRAVLLHESHHRAARAPARAAALEAWCRIGRWVPPLERRMRDRLADLESDADAAALRAGASRTTIARALLKVSNDDAAATARFATTSRRRVRRLTRPGAGPGLALPYEWLGPALLATIIAACHAVWPAIS